MENTIPTRKETKNLPNNDAGQHRYEHSKPNSHNVQDQNDQYSLADRAKLEQKLEQEEGKAPADTPAAGWWERDIKLRPTQVAERHGNKPSRGAQVDEQIENEEIEELKRKGKI